MKRATLIASIAWLTAAVAPVCADEWNVVVTPQGHNIFYYPQFPAFLTPAPVDPYTSTAFEPGPFAFGPTDEAVPFDLGTVERPWSTVYAAGYAINGHVGLTANVPLGNGCILKIRGGLVVNVTGSPSFMGACKQ